MKNARLSSLLLSIALSMLCIGQILVWSQQYAHATGTNFIGTDQERNFTPAPRTISYHVQPFLNAIKPNPTSGTISLTFHLYDNTTSTTPLWSERFDSVDLSIPFVNLGSTAAFPNDLWSKKSLFLEIVWNTKANFPNSYLPGALKNNTQTTAPSSYITAPRQPFTPPTPSFADAHAVPPGTITPYAGNTVPTGWLLCDGRTVREQDYPRLYAAIGVAHGDGNDSSDTTFNLPDYRGRFLRGVDHGKGNDPDSSTRTAANHGGNTGNLVGSVQSFATARPTNPFVTGDESQRHTHAFADAYIRECCSGGAEGLDGNDTDNHYLINSHGTDANSSSHTHVANIGGDAETRPINVSVYYIIKY